MSMASSSDNVAGEDSSTVYRRYDDGYIVRAMTYRDASVVQRWFTAIGIMSKFDLDIPLSIFPSELRGFYIGEFEGQVVASAVRVPWGDNICYGSYYYVDAPYRSRGFGTRLRDEVAREHVGNKLLCIDAVLGKVAENNALKFGYHSAFKTGRFQGKAKSPSSTIESTQVILPIEQVDFQKFIEYDNKCFVSKNFKPRHDFLRLWTQIPNGATYVALSDTTSDSHVIGFGCRRPAIQPLNHELGPLYADSSDVAEALLDKLCSEVADENVTIQIWYHNCDAVSMMTTFDFKNVFDVLHMHLNGDHHHEENTRVYGVTSIEVCGF